MAVQVQLAFAFELRVMQARCGYSGPGSSMVYWCIGVLVYGLCSALLAAAGETVWSVAIRGRYGGRSGTWAGETGNSTAPPPPLTVA